jgi:hypothetical protein
MVRAILCYIEIFEAYCHLNKTGLWDYDDIYEPLPAQQVLHQQDQFIGLNYVNEPCALNLVQSFVKISVYVLLKLDGFRKAHQVLSLWTY